MNHKEKIIRLSAFLGGIYFVLYFILPERIIEYLGVSTAHEYISYGFILVGAIAFGVGLVNLALVHGSNLLFLRRDWFFSGTLLLGLALMLFLAFADWRNDLQIASRVKRIEVLSLYANKLSTEKKERGAIKGTSEALFFRTLQDVSAEVEHGQVSPDTVQDLKKITTIDETTPQTLSAVAQRYGEELQKKKSGATLAQLFHLFNESFFISLGSAMFSLLGVYIAAAAFRAFRIKSFESALMMIAAVIVMLGQIPFGMWISDSLPSIRLWLLQVPNGAAFRAIRIGAAVAGLVLSLRMWLSIDRKSTS